MGQLKKLYITFVLLTLVSFLTLSSGIQVSQAKVQSDFLQDLHNEFNQATESDDDLQPNQLQADDSVSTQKQLIQTNDIADSAVTKEKLDPNAVKLVVVERSNTFEIPTQHEGEGIANCNSDEFVTGGGYQFNVFQNTIFKNQKEGNGWKLQAFNPDPDARTAFVYALCAHLELGP